MSRTTTSLSGRGQDPASRGNRSRLLAGGFPVDPSTGLVTACRETTRDVAVRRAYQICVRNVSACLTHRQQQNAALQVFCSKPSDGLEPLTPSLPWRFWGVTRVHARSLATQFFLQIGPNKMRPGMRREASRVSFLMCPFCVRDLSSVLATHLRNVVGAPDLRRDRPSRAIRTRRRDTTRTAANPHGYRRPARPTRMAASFVSCRFPGRSVRVRYARDSLGPFAEHLYRPTCTPQATRPDSRRRPLPFQPGWGGRRRRVDRSSRRSFRGQAFACWLVGCCVGVRW